MKSPDRKIAGLFIAGFLMILAAFALDQSLFPAASQYYVDKRMQAAQNELIQKELEGEKMLAELSRIRKTPDYNDQAKIIEQSRRKKIFLYVFQNQSLIFWTSHSVFPNKVGHDTNSFVQELGNGIYLQRNIRRGPLIFISLIPIQYDYAFENQYLQDKLAFSHTEDLNFSLHFDPAKGYKFQSAKDRYLFSIEARIKDNKLRWVAWLYLLGLFICLLTLHAQLKHYIRKGYWRQAYILFGSLLVFISVTVWLQLPRQLFQTRLFDPQYYASSYWLPSLGHLLVFSLFIFYLTWFLLRIPHWPGIRRLVPLPLRLPLASLLTILFGSIVVLVAKSLVLNSQISFDLGNIYSLNIFSIVGLLIIAGWLGCFLAVAAKLAASLARHFRSKRKYGNFIAFVFVASALMLALMQLPYWVYLTYAAIAISGLYFHFRNKTRSRAGIGIGILMLSAAFLCIILSRYNAIEQREKQLSVADVIAKERDPVAEYLFREVYSNLQNDYYLKNFFLNPILSDLVLKRRVRQLYFSGYFSKYDIDLVTFTPGGIPFNSTVERPLDYYRQLLEKDATSIKDGQLYFLHHYAGLPAYIAIIPIYRQDQLLGNLLVEFRKKAFYEESVYPELLLSEDVKRLEEAENYSYAIYNNRILLTQRGEYSYPARLNIKLEEEKDFGTYETGDYQHLVYRETPQLYVIVSMAKKNLLYYMSIFAFILFFLTLSLALFLLLAYASSLLRKPFKKLLNSVFRENVVWRRLSFRYKILATVLTGMSLALLLIGFATIQYISYQYNKDELEKIRQQTREISTRLASELQNYDPLHPVEEEELNRLIKSLSDMYQADLNVYDIGGNLISTTQNLIYERRIIEPKMDALAFLKFNVLYSSQVLQEERIGGLQYTSAYMPLRNAAGEIIGYVNHPYFTKEAELKAKISSFLVALVNLYLLLFLILLALGIFMTRAITAPLDIIRNHLRNTSLRGTNELIRWNTNDEIGKLVKEYNAMILALKESVERLAQSEREGAWREMAKQVAHEIKNPLTPMKLNIQRLQRAYEEDLPDKGPLFEKVTNLLIRQIDSLSQIATAFSAFAKMPQGEPGEVDLNSLLTDEAELFSQNSAVDIELELPEEHLRVYADANQLNRVFNNIIKNGIQAIPEEREGVIFIKAEKSGSFADIHISDNGTGIPAELQEKIFLPNFSTKSSGMGLGLAIVKNIIEKSGGSISFTTVPDEGTTFHIRLPLLDEGHPVLQNPIL